MRGDCFSKCFPLFEASGSLPTVFLFLSLRNQHQKKFTEHFSVILSDTLTIFHKKAINPLWKVKNPLKEALRKKCPYSELFWSLYKKYLSIFSPHAENAGKMRARITPNTDTFYAVQFFQLLS